MKRSFFLITCCLLAVLAIGQQTPAGPVRQPAPVDPSVSRTIRITGTRLTYPLVQRWIDEYTKVHPGVKIIVSSKIPADSADIIIASHILRQGDVKEDREAIALSRYVQLPVISSRRSDVAVLQAKGFNDGAFRQVYFSDSSIVGAAAGNYHFAVYKREKPACASIAFANHFGSEQKDIKGIGVAGDDRDLLEAVKKDTNGISYNNLGFIYDIKTRRVVDSIAIIPIDLNGNGKTDADENIYGTLDEVVAFVEKTHHPRIPLENVNVLFRKGNPDKEVYGFLKWALVEGQAFNHEYGFINIDTSVAQTEGQLLASFVVKL
jgi:phosphate transport system substrate-binding protein